MTQDERSEQLEERVRELEARVTELERFIARATVHGLHD